MQSLCWRARAMRSGDSDGLSPCAVPLPLRPHLRKIHAAESPGYESEWNAENAASATDICDSLDTHTYTQRKRESDLTIRYIGRGAQTPARRATPPLLLKQTTSAEECAGQRPRILFQGGIIYSASVVAYALVTRRAVGQWRMSMIERALRGLRGTVHVAVEWYID